jgi:hypothetical protein
MAAALKDHWGLQQNLRRIFRSCHLLRLPIVPLTFWQLIALWIVLNLRHVV